ncbi:class I SAM-dependent methyltransferase [Radicibacter daui]|uniref:class I SAM-dependent methyltransferase n=1 Tax=Radicibacter daui TaxID=3064829 RepID=UPI004046952B
MTLQSSPAPLATSADSSTGMAGMALDVMAGEARQPGWFTRRALHALLATLQAGRLTVHLPDGSRLDHAGRDAGPEAMLILHNWRPLRRLLIGGDTGFAEAYMEGDWTSPDLMALLELAARNIGALNDRLGGLWPLRLARRLAHLARPNSRSGSRRNIAAHYDLGNAFYAEWLDERMLYSAALYSDSGQTLEAAQAAKLARIRELLAVPAGARVLEIGCGWGALAADIGAEGAHVTGLTLSREQHAHARAVMEKAGLQERVDIRLQDYRDVSGRFERIVSIEMIEAVGEAYWPTYFARLRECLAPGGRVVLQAITIAPERFEGYRRSADFIQSYVFPGGMLLTEGAIAEQGLEAGLKLVAKENFGIGYALTLADWRRRFHAAWPRIARLGFDERFRRLWDYYLCYCEAGFRAGTIDVGFYVLEG